MTPPVGQHRPTRLVLPSLWLHPPTLEATVATITDRLGPFTGQVGPVRFVKGVATTEDADMVAYFREDADRYDVVTDDLPTPEQVAAAIADGTADRLVIPFHTPDDLED